MSTMRTSKFKFRLYVAGEAQNSSAAIANLNFLCRNHLADRHEIEIIDVFREPQRALKDGVFMTPTLVKIRPAPTKKVIGTLSKAETVLQAIGVQLVD